MAAHAAFETTQKASRKKKETFIGPVSIRHDELAKTASIV